MISNSGLSFEKAVDPFADRVVVSSQVIVQRRWECSRQTPERPGIPRWLASQIDRSLTTGRRGRAFHLDVSLPMETMSGGVVVLFQFG